MTEPISIRALQQVSDPELMHRRQELKTPDSKESFGNMLTRAVNNVDQTLKESDQNVQDFIAGKTDNVHDVMISMQRAQISFQMMVEIRNKAIETYNEISRMQI